LPLGWWRRRQRRKLLQRPISPIWERELIKLPFVEALSSEQRVRLVEIARVIAAEKRWEACGGLEFSDAMPVVISLQAALLILEIDHHYYRGVKSIFIYPSTYVRPQKTRAESGDLQVILGEAWLRGPTVLAWDATKRGAYHPHDGRNLVWHEFSHKLDMRDGLIDGTPPLAKRSDYLEWREVLSREFEALKEDVQKGRRTVLDRYGTTNAPEFFAVSTEAFFEKGVRLKRKHPALYDTLRKYYRQDPAAWGRLSRYQEPRDEG